MLTRGGCIALALVLGTGAASASDPTPGFGASLRVGYGSPAGSITTAPGDGLGDAISGSLPLQVDVGYRVTPELAVAAFGQYAFAAVSSRLGCVRQGLSCSARDVRVGLEVLWRFLPGHLLDPWVGAGVGWEWTTFRAEGGGDPVEVTLHGLEYGNAQLGADYALAPGLSVGPFVQLTVASYATAAGIHEWLQVGIRGSLGL